MFKVFLDSSGCFFSSLVSIFVSSIFSSLTSLISGLTTASSFTSNSIGLVSFTSWVSLTTSFFTGCFVVAFVLVVLGLEVVVVFFCVDFFLGVSCVVNF